MTTTNIEGHGDSTPKQPIMNKKPVLYRGAKTVLTTDSEKFQDKLLCDGLTLNPGDACAFGCTYCYAEKQVVKFVKPVLDAHKAETAQDVSVGDVVIRRRNAVETLRSQLIRPDGSNKYDDPRDTRVVYSSTLVDVAANMELLREIAELCILILLHTNWQIRLLSKSALLARLVTDEMILKKYHSRLILGFSIGTLDDKVARAIEIHTSSPTARIKALHELQDRGLRTFGMICPSLPQADYEAFSREICDAIRVDKCEHVWAEVLNVRGESLTNTVGALRNAGLEDEADRLEAVCGSGVGGKWEDYARQTFSAHTHNVPGDKLRFLQYVTADNVDWWQDQRSNGAVLLGKMAEERLITSGTTPDTQEKLTPEELRYRGERENIVTSALKASIAAAKAIHEIFTYSDGKLWKIDHKNFRGYCLARWGYNQAHCYRLQNAGRFIAELEADFPPNGGKPPIHEGQVRPLLAMVPEELQTECWDYIVDKKTPEELTGSIVKEEAKKFLKDRAPDTKTANLPTPPDQSTPNPRAVAMRELKRLKAALENLQHSWRFEQLTKGIEALIAEEPEGPGNHERALLESKSTLPDRTPKPRTSRKTGSDVSTSQNPEPSSTALQGAGQELQDRVVKAMEEVAPPNEKSEASTEPVQVTPIAPAQPMGEEYKAYISAPIFHAALHPGGDYPEWRAAVIASHPADIIIPTDGGDARISFVRARNISFNDNGAHASAALKLVCEAENSGDEYPGAAADNLLAAHTQAARSGPHSRPPVAAGT